jgi:hypothetical protein
MSISITVNGQSGPSVTATSGDTIGVTVSPSASPGPAGPQGPVGPSNSLAIGTVASGSTASATITGTAPSQTINLVLPVGATGPAGPVGSVGATGSTGPANSLSVGTVASGITASATITGAAPSQKLNLVLPVGATGAAGPAGPAGPAVNLSDETPQPLGIASSGTALTASRADHTHAAPAIAYSMLTGVPSTFAPAAHQHAVSDVTGLQTALDAKQAAGSYATLVNGTVPSSMLPSFVDDVREAASFSAFPTTGDAGVIYVAVDTRKIFRWAGSTYVEISSSPGTTTDVPEGTNLYFTDARAIAAAPVQSVAGRTGIVTLAQLGSSGTASSTTFLRGDGAWAVPAGGGSFAGTVDGGDYVGTIIGGGGGGGGGSPTTDPLFSSVRLLINADLATYAYDQSANNWTVSSVGNAAATTANPKWGAKSLAFDGNGDYLRVVTGSSSFPFGTGDFTAEAWIWFPSLPVSNSSNQYFSLFDTRSGYASAYGYAVFVNSSGQLGANWGDTQNGATLLGGSLDAAAWHHVALVRSAGTMRLYANGICVASGSTNVSVNLSHDEVWISRSFAESSFLEANGLMGYWNGNIDDIRLTAAARYTGTSSTSTNFAVPTAAFPTS